MESVTRVTFRFRREIEVHYLSRLPERGDYITHLHELWVVTSVEEDAVGPVVVCERESR